MIQMKMISEYTFMCIEYFTHSAFKRANLSAVESDNANILVYKNQLSRTLGGMPNMSKTDWQ